MDLRKHFSFIDHLFSSKRIWRLISAFLLGLLASLLLFSSLSSSSSSSSSSSATSSFFSLFSSLPRPHANTTSLFSPHLLNLTASLLNANSSTDAKEPDLGRNSSSSLNQEPAIANAAAVAEISGNGSAVVDDGGGSGGITLSPPPPPPPAAASVMQKNASSVSELDKVRKRTEEDDCDIFDGRWVKDERAQPFYAPGSCPHIDIDFDCHRNGRTDVGYLGWRWQPSHCDIPRLNATDFLARLRGKRLIFVGDSLNRNMWESLVCILRDSVKLKERVYEASGRHEFKTKGYYSFRFEDYNCSVDFVRSPFLVKELYLKMANGSEDERLRLDLLDETTSAYWEADIIVFNTGHWWTHEKTSQGIDYYQEGDYIYPVLKVMDAYKKALATWATWVDKNINSSKTQVFFRGYSLTHFRGGQWNSGGQCHKETEPIFNETFLTKYPSKMRTLEQTLEQMKTPVIYLNISKLTDYRKDGHPSIYRKKYDTVEELAAAEKSQDCSHWCLPGVPDTWNELLYASLLINGKGSWRR